MKKLIIVFLLIIPTTVFGALSETDYIKTCGSVGLFLSSEIFQEKLAPESPRWTSQNLVDKKIRDHLKWRNTKLSLASDISDGLLYGVFIPSLVVTPKYTEDSYEDDFSKLLFSFGLTGIATNSIKYITGRERPYGYYGTRKSNGKDDNLSFFSGHTSIAFSIGTSSAYLLSERYPKNEELIWISSYTLAISMAYLRIASDKHYFSDVLVGGLVGSAIGYFVVSRDATSDKSNNRNMILFSTNISF